MTITNNSIATFFFVVFADGSNYCCNYCQVDINQEPGKGYCNLLSHVRAKHSDYKIVISNYAKDVAAGSTMPGNFLYISDNAIVFYRWLE